LFVLVKQEYVKINIDIPFCKIAIVFGEFYMVFAKKNEKFLKVFII